MWRVADQDAAREARLHEILRRNKRLTATHVPIDYAERVKRAVFHGSSNDDHVQLRTPPRDLYLRDSAGRSSLEQIDLQSLPISGDWITTIVNDLTAIASDAKKKTHGNHTTTTTTTTTTTILNVAATSVSDAMLAPVQRLRQLREINISRCTALTDESLTLLRRHFSSTLEVLDISECRHFTSDVLCHVWRDCSKLHTLAAYGSMAANDTFLQCISTTKRSSAGQNRLRSLDLRHCKHVTSSGISHLASSTTTKALAITTLRLGDCLDVDNMAFFGFENSASVADLTVLDLSGLGIDETAISWIAKGCQRLEQLHLSRCRSINDFALLLLSPLVATHLRVLTLRACVLVGDAGIQNLFAVAQEKRVQRKEQDRDHEQEHGDEEEEEHAPLALQVLDLEACSLIGDATLVLLGRYCGKLTKLNLRGLRKVSDAGIVAMAKGCPELTSIKISGRHITEQTFKILGKISPCLARLDISERRDLDTPACFVGLTSGVRPDRLLKLNFGATNICDVGVSILATACPRLQWINLSKCPRVSDIAIEALAYCCHAALETLLLANTTTAVTDKSLIACALMRLPLRVVDLSGNTSITETGVATLAASCQQIQELRLKGCDRLSFQTITRAHSVLPFTRTPTAPTLAQKLATGGGRGGGSGNGHALLPLPPRHVQLLELLVKRYEAASVLQARFRKWRQKDETALLLARRKFQRHTRAARKIQKCVRAFLTWRRYLRHLEIGRNVCVLVYVQSHVRGNQSRYCTKIVRFTKHRAAKCIQRGYRPHFTARMRVRHANARTIQRVFRGFLGRRLFKQELLAQQLTSARKIWVWYRRCVNQRQARARATWLVRKIHNIQGQWRKYKCRQNLTKYLGYYRTHATKIQTIWRGFSTRRRVQQLRILWTQAATAIQRVVRAHRTRCVVYKYRLLANQQATVVQKQWRRFAGQRRYRRYYLLVIHTQRTARYVMRARKWRALVSQVVLRHRNAAALLIQRVLRGHYGRRRALLFRKIRNATYAKKGQNTTQAWIRHGLIRNGAAIHVQRFVRRYQARRKMPKLKKWKRFVAARCLQRYLKHWIRKLRLQRKREAHTHAVLAIQRVYRGHLSRVAVRNERHRQACLRSAKLVQRVYRGYKGRCEFQQCKREMTQAARMLQRAYRGRNTRKLFEISQAAAALKAKEKYDKSLLGMLDAKRNPMDELYRRAKLPHEKDLLQKLHDKWQANRLTEERAVRKLTREHTNQVWPSAQETIDNHLGVRAKLYGVTENVYVTRRELLERQQHQQLLKQELVELHANVWKCQQALRAAVASRRMLDGKEILEIMKTHKLLLENVALASSNQDGL